jgi:hypothetical protein
MAPGACEVRGKEAAIPAQKAAGAAGPEGLATVTFARLDSSPDGATTTNTPPARARMTCRAIRDSERQARAYDA